MVAKDHSLVKTILSGFLKHWPKANSTKQLSFFEMLQVIFRYTNEDDLLPIINPILSRILLSLKSKDFRVVHQASSLLFMSRSLLNCTSKIPLKCPLLNVIDTLHFLSTSFWNEYIYCL